jgi:anti-sigma regulatory factor (Ser/Thr protein kinase)
MRAVRAQGVPSDAWDVIELLTGEILANAVLHGPDSGDIRVRTWRYGRLVSVAVSDQSAARPVVRDLAPTATSGRGMMLVDTLSSSWGVDDRGAAGKTVWFNLDVGAA